VFHRPRRNAGQDADERETGDSLPQAVGLGDKQVRGHADHETDTGWYQHDQSRHDERQEGSVLPATGVGCAFLWVCPYGLHGRFIGRHSKKEKRNASLKTFYTVFP
jgi:hypothetical protein